MSAGQERSFSFETLANPLNAARAATHKRGLRPWRGDRTEAHCRRVSLFRFMAPAPKFLVGAGVCIKKAFWCGAPKMVGDTVVRKSGGFGVERTALCSGLLSDKLSDGNRVRADHLIQEKAQACQANYDEGLTSARHAKNYKAKYDERPTAVPQAINFSRFEMLPGNSATFKRTNGPTGPMLQPRIALEGMK